MEENYELYKERDCISERNILFYLHTKRMPSYSIENSLYLIRKTPKV